MAFTPSSLCLKWQPFNTSSVAPKEFCYVSTDASTAVAASGYFSDGYARGMRLGDILETVVSSSTRMARGVVSVANSSGPCTVVFGSMTST